MRRVNDCMNDSGGVTGDNTNNLLESEIEAKKPLGPLVIPSVFINEITMRGYLNQQTVFSSICTGFKDGTAPNVCDQCNGCPNLGE